MLPQLATYAGARAHAADERIDAALSPAELTEWHTAVSQAESEGTFFIALPFHCAVGHRPAGRSADRVMAFPSLGEHRHDFAGEAAQALAPARATP
jgi:hypothetical protein